MGRRGRTDGPPEDARGAHDLVIVNAVPFVTADGLAQEVLAERATVLAGQDIRGAVADELATLWVVRIQVLGLGFSG